MAMVSSQRTNNFGFNFIVFSAVLLLLSLELEVTGWRPFRLDIVNITTTSLSPKCRINSSVTPSSVLNLNIQFLETVKNPHTHIGIFFESSGGIYDMEVINRTIDMCRFYRDIRYEPILQVGSRLYKKNSNFMSKCPIAKGVYSIKDKELNVENLPPMFPEKSGYYNNIFMNKRQRLFQATVFFRIRKVFKNNLSN